MWLYPLPSFIALAGWLFIYLTLSWQIILMSFAALAIGIVSFLAWSASTQRWPFQKTAISND